MSFAGKKRVAGWVPNSADQGKWVLPFARASAGCVTSMGGEVAVWKLGDKPTPCSPWLPKFRARLARGASRLQNGVVRFVDLETGKLAGDLWRK